MPSRTTIMGDIEPCKIGKCCSSGHPSCQGIQKVHARFLPSIGQPTSRSRVRKKCSGHIDPGLSSVRRAEHADRFCCSSRGSHSSKDPTVLRIDEADLPWEGHLDRCLLPGLTAISSMQDLSDCLIRLGRCYRCYGSSTKVCDTALRECGARRRHIRPMDSSIRSAEHGMLAERPSCRRIYHMKREQCI